MSLVSPQEVWGKSTTEGVGIGQFALGLDLTLKAMQMALDHHDSSLTVPIFLQGLQNVELGYSVTFESQSGKRYTIGPIDNEDRSLIYSGNSSRELADQIDNLRKFAQSKRIDIDAVR